MVLPIAFFEGVKLSQSSKNKYVLGPLKGCFEACLRDPTPKSMKILYAICKIGENTEAVHAKKGALFCSRYASFMLKDKVR
jgi:hypothetical protein